MQYPCSQAHPPGGIERSIAEVRELVVQQPQHKRLNFPAFFQSLTRDPGCCNFIKRAGACGFFFFQSLRRETGLCNLARIKLIEEVLQFSIAEARNRSLQLHAVWHLGPARVLSIAEARESVLQPGK